MFNLLLVILPCLSTFYFTYTYYDEFYAPNSQSLYLLCAAGVVISLLLTLPSFGKGNKAVKLLFAFSPFMVLYAFTYNAFVWVVLMAALVILSIALPHKKVYIKYVFNENNTPVATVAHVKKTFRQLYHRGACIVSAGMALLFVLTCIFTDPSPFWQTRAFPIDFSEKAIPEGAVYASGKVTSTAWYDPNALLVTEFFDIDTEEGICKSPCQAAGMLSGDIITHINSQPAYTSDFITKGATKEAATLTVLRSSPNGQTENITFEVTPVYSSTENRYLIGITFYTTAMVATSVQTLSFTYPETGYFAATAHSSSEVYTGADSLTGLLLDSRATGRDSEGLTVVPQNNVIGTIVHTNDYGAFGVVGTKEGLLLPIAKKNEVHFGSATLLSNFEGGACLQYNVFITGTYRINSRDVICFIVTDERIKNAGGVTRGMSGSPIIQDGKVVGALSNMDPGGYSAYATFAYDMAHQLHIASDKFTK